MTTVFPPGVVHLHVSTACNLACRHCYSDSSPSASQELDVADCVAALEVLAGSGFTHLSVSGGEPTLYGGLDEVLEAARRTAMSASVVTNGLVSSERVLSRLAGFDSVAVSVDGLRESHDRLRRRDGSFDKALRTVRLLAERGSRVGVVSCVSAATLSEVADLWQLADDAGAALFQVRPLVNVGRAQDELFDEESGAAPDLNRLGLTAALLASIDDGPSVQCDLAGTGSLLEAVDELIAALEDPDTPPAQLLSPLVVDESGRLRPYSYNLVGFELGTLGELSEFGPVEWLDRGRARLLELHWATRRRIEDHGDGFVDWFALLVEASHRLGTAVAV